MLFFGAMQTTAFTQVLGEIQKIAAAVDERRGEFAVTLWLVSDWLQDLPGSLVSWRDDVDVGGGHFLSIEPLEGLPPTQGNPGQEGLPGRRWNLCLSSEEGVVPAHDGPSGCLAPAVDRLPAFLQLYGERLEAAFGKSATGDASRELTKALFSMTESTTP